MKKIINQKGFLSIVVLLVVAAIIGYLSYNATVQPGDNPQTEGFKRQIDKAKDLIDIAEERVKNIEEEFSDKAGEIGEKIDVSLKIAEGENLYEFSEQISEGISVFEFMKLLSENEDFDFEYKESNLGAFVDEIKGIKNDAENNFYWMFYVNDKLSEAGASGYIPSPGDKIEWKYEDASSYWQ